MLGRSALTTKEQVALTAIAFCPFILYVEECSSALDSENEEFAFHDHHH